ncbi:MAG TPA: ABC transporter permease [Blastocatellia bacterium]|nr:ABC transporter permease [Blastocatellia bacterium]
METLGQDLNYGLRLLREHPGFTLAVVLTLGLGIGATTAIFIVVNAVLLRPLPYQQPERLIYVKEVLDRELITPFVVSSEYLAWKNQSRTLSHIAAYHSTRANLTGGDQAERVTCGKATASFFPLLGVQPLMGRVFLPADDLPGSPPVVILSHALWSRHFGGDPSVVGRFLTLDGRSHTVIGVLPANFLIPDRYAFSDGSGYDAWTPFKPGETGKTAPVLMRVIGRLDSGVSLEYARAELDTILQPTVHKGHTRHVLISQWQEEITGDAKPSLLLLLAAVGLLLLIACANVANLLLARSGSREKEIAVRLALGAGKYRILRQLLTESLLLAGLGGVAGLALALWGKDLLVAFISPNLPALGPVSLDHRVLCFNLGLTFFTGLACGLAPASQALKVQLVHFLKEAGRSRSETRRRRRLRDLLVVFETALAMMLLIGAGLLIQSFARLRGIETGFNRDHILSLSLALTESDYPAPRDQARYFEQVIDHIKGLPGVQAAGANTTLPLGSYGTKASANFEGLPGGDLEFSWATVSPDYLRAMGIPILRGRGLSDADGEGSPSVALVNESFVRRYCPSDDCLGRKVESWMRENDRITIVGVVGNVRPSPETDATPEVYLSYLQAPEAHMYVVVRTVGDPMSLATAVRSRIASLDRRQPPFDIRTLEQRVADSISPWKVNMLLLGVFAALGLVLGAIGIYGVVSYSVSQRVHEIGIRLALGAQPKDVLSLVVGQGVLVVFAGEVIGLAGVLMLNKVMSSLVFGVGTTDAPTYAAVFLLWALIALLACYLPARRATKVDPMVALRCE